MCRHWRLSWRGGSGAEEGKEQHIDGWPWGSVQGLVLSTEVFHARKGTWRAMTWCRVRESIPWLLLICTSASPGASEELWRIPRCLHTASSLPFILTQNAVLSELESQCGYSLHKYCCRNKERCFFLPYRSLKQEELGGLTEEPLFFFFLLLCLSEAFS